jgi:hypothetical protein
VIRSGKGLDGLNVVEHPLASGTPGLIDFPAIRKFLV